MPLYGRRSYPSINWKKGYGTLAYFMEYGWNCKVISSNYINASKESVKPLLLKPFFTNKNKEINYDSFKDGKKDYYKGIENDPSAILIETFFNGLSKTKTTSN